MIKGIGIDIIEINRIAKAIDKSPRFIERIFTENEISILNKNNMKPASVAGFFAAKEAVVKALGTGLRDMKWKDIEILKDELGKPLVLLHNNALKTAYSRNINTILITISHSKENAVAHATALGKNGDL